MVFSKKKKFKLKRSLPLRLSGTWK